MAATTRETASRSPVTVTKLSFFSCTTSSSSDATARFSNARGTKTDTVSLASASSINASMRAPLGPANKGQNSLEMVSSLTTSLEAFSATMARILARAAATAEESPEMLMGIRGPSSASPLVSGASGSRGGTWICAPVESVMDLRVRPGQNRQSRPVESTKAHPWRR